MSKLVPGKMYTHTEVANARTKGQIIGWVQGGVATFAALWVLNIVGWLPTIIIIGVVGVLAAKVLFGKHE